VLDEVLERLQLLEELIGRDLPVGRRSTEEPRRGVDRGPPGDLVGFRRLIRRAGLRARRLDLVEVDVAEAALLFLVELDARRPALGLAGAATDVGPERRVLVAVVVDEHPARVAGLRLELLHGPDVDGLLHGPLLPRA
jgi:hypothetical protein